MKSGDNSSAPAQVAENEMEEQLPSDNATPHTPPGSQTALEPQLQNAEDSRPCTPDSTPRVRRRRRMFLSVVVFLSVLCCPFVFRYRD